MKFAEGEIRAADRLAVLSRVAAAIVIIASSLIFLGWALGLPALTRLLPLLVVMSPLTSLTFVAVGLALWCLPTPRVSAPHWCAARTVLGLFVALVGAAKLSNFLLGWGPPVDRWLFASRLSSPGVYPLSEMAPNTALALLLSGLAMALADWQTRRGPPPAHLLMIITGFIALLALVGYTYRVLVLYRLGSEMPMSLDSALASGLITFGFFTAQPDRGFMRLALSSTTAGASVRRLLPMAIAVPWLLGALILLAEKTGFLALGFGLATFAVSTMLIFTGLIWWNARRLFRADLQQAHAAERLRQASANLERSNSELQQFAYVASHDLFEPLRMITSYLQLVQARHAANLDNQAREFIAFAIDGAKRMHALIQDLLAYSRVELRGLPFEPTDCEQILQAALRNLKVAIEETGAVITHEPLPQVRVDAVQLTQLLQNLIGNAIKFRGTTPPRVHIAARKLDGEWIFSVRDNGIGIDPKDFERIFVIFQRLHTRQEYAGTGIGLAICKKIVERHGGRIWVESSPGHGAVFHFTLPVA